MPRASRKCCTLAPLPWAAPPRGRSSSITHRQYASYARGGRGGGVGAGRGAWGRGSGTTGPGAPNTHPLYRMLQASHTYVC